MGRLPQKHGIYENGVQKGAWSPEEDEKLVAYINKYGIWNWNQMAKPAGLSRTGKSCRLRWMNYLRPDVRHGNFTKEEEEIIIKWHQRVGNRWSAIAAKLRGRSDNEVKNYWNTRLKRRYENSNVHSNNAVDPPNSPATASDHDQESIQQIGAQEDQSKPNTSILTEVPACSSSNDACPLDLDDELQNLLTQMFPEEEQTYMALDGRCHGNSGHTSTVVDSQGIDGTSDHVEDFIFDLWEIW